jgi:hypothetical protein
LNERISSADFHFFLVANVLVLGLFAYAFVLESAYSDFYYLSVQEDEYLEWASFWAFLLAAVVFIRRAANHRQATDKFPWFLYGVALFCFIVAMEEISWGQRLFGYRPPAYFLEHNYQQEFNFHNVVETDYRKLALMLVIAGYGIVLPLVAQWGLLKSWLGRIGIVAPTIALLPAFAGTLLLYVIYPFSHSGEWVELMLGLSFLFSAVSMARDYRDEQRSPNGRRFGASATSAIVFIAAISLGLVSATATRAQRNARPENMQATRTELEAISHDFAEGLASSECNLHKRLYTFVEEYDQVRMYDGSFSRLQSQGLPKQRADFFLDPWNSPYWIRDRCIRDTDERIAFVYSFGPNRKRESSRTEILGDDIGTHIPVQ